MESKDRYILLVKKNRIEDISNVGPDKIRYDNKLKEFVYGADSYFKTKNGGINLSNKKSRSDNKNIYEAGITSDGTCYFDEKGKLYRFNDNTGLKTELIFDSSKPDEIRFELIEE